MVVSKMEEPILLSSEKTIPRGARRVDALLGSQEELFIVRHPEFRKQPFRGLPEWNSFLKKTKGREQWVYFPWNHTAVRVLDEQLYFELRTARNKNLITKAEQDRYRNFKVGIAGLSVGSSIISSLVLTGGPKVLKIADFDVLMPSNMNRIRSSVADLGVSKIELAARDVWGMDPFAKLYLWDKGVSRREIGKFLTGAPRLDVFIDEMDNLEVKVAARLIAKRERIPVLMATDYGDSVLLDVERFDREPRRPIFHGIVGNLTAEQASEAKGSQWFALVEKIIGGKFMPKRHRDSLREVGKTLAGVPQLGTDALFAGAVVSLAVRKIANHGKLPSGRYLADLNGMVRLK
ncbi:MAG: ThiF family adenylyltransferase [Patescibacteria group bacterium]|nr:ThiF family adenylyltransferase [Patescibacteria group bacterium]